MSPDSPKINEIARPSWRNAEAYASALQEPSVAGTIKAHMADNHTSKHGLRWKETAAEEIEAALPALMKTLRLFDTGQFAYWIATFCLVSGYLFLEAAVLHVFARGRFPVAMTFIICLMSFLAVYLTCAVALLYRESSGQKPPRCLRKFNLQNFLASPVFLVTIVLVAANVLLVATSGWSQSPFLPALIFVSMNIISAPRENNKSTVWLTIIAVALILVCQNLQLGDPPSDSTSLVLGKTLGVLTLVFSVMIRIMQRQFSSLRIAR